MSEQQIIMGAEYIHIKTGAIHILSMADIDEQWIELL